MPANMYKTNDNKRVPSVTTILGNLGWSSGALMYWAWQQGIEGKNFRETASKAADVGTLAHYGVEADVKGQEFDVDKIEDLTDEDREMVRRCLNAYYKWKKMTSMEMLHSEVLLVSEEHRFGGQLDICALAMDGDDSRRAIIDYKTSNAVYESHIIQIAAYGILWNEHHPDEPIEEYHLLRTGKDNASFEHRYWEAGPKWDAGPVRSFLLARELHELKKKMKRF
jgi:hypothetical protein